MRDEGGTRWRTGERQLRPRRGRAPGVSDTGQGGRGDHGHEAEVSMRPEPRARCPAELDLQALNFLTYGLYILTARDGDKLNGCIVNTIVQVAAEPC